MTADILIDDSPVIVDKPVVFIDDAHKDQRGQLIVRLDGEASLRVHAGPCAYDVANFKIELKPSDVAAWRVMAFDSTGKNLGAIMYTGAGAAYGAKLRVVDWEAVGCSATMEALVPLASALPPRLVELLTRQLEAEEAFQNAKLHDEDRRVRAATEAFAVGKVFDNQPDPAVFDFYQRAIAARKDIITWTRDWLSKKNKQ